ncbi:MAG: hypothetical protein EOP92_21475 [Lysobacteraceae bacterium]|nr:MAG: hypothetical protein EOP92_21475 [Xanthomonadaceae bacterium]
MLYLLLPALLALAPAVALAKPAPPRPDDAGAAVPETRYRPPQAYRPAERPATTPDRHWIEANRSVLGYNPMMLTMPERGPAPAPADQPKPAPGTPPAPDHAAHDARQHKEHH